MTAGAAKVAVEFVTFGRERGIVRGFRSGIGIDEAAALDFCAISRGVSEDASTWTGTPMAKAAPIARPKLKNSLNALSPKTIFLSL